MRILTKKFKSIPMPDEQTIRSIIKTTIITSIESFAERTLNKKRKFQILDLLIPNERKIRSIVGGLETSLGSTLWEPLGKALARGNGFEVIQQDLMMPTNMPSVLNNALQDISGARKNNDGTYDAASSHLGIRNACRRFRNNPIDNFIKPPSGRGVDIWLRKNEINYFFDTKTVQPNLSALSSCLDQVLGWYAYYYSRYPDGQAEGRIVFPYNPTPDYVYWDTLIGNGKPLEPGVEAWVENEFWDFVSGYSNTYSVITSCFNELRESGELSETLQEILESE